MRFYKNSGGISSNYRRWFKRKNDPHVMTGGDFFDGLVCYGRDDGSEAIHCTVWRQIDPDVMMKAITGDIWGKSRDEVRSMVEDAFEFTRMAFSDLIEVIDENLAIVPHLER